MIKRNMIMYGILVSILLILGCSSDEVATSDNPNTFISDSNQMSTFGENTYTETNTEQPSFASNFRNFVQDVANDPAAYLSNIYNLEEEYSRVSKQTDAIQEEYKATINAYNAAESYRDDPNDEKNLIRYEKRMNRLIEIREESMQQSLEVGPDISKSSDLNWVINTLHQNSNILSDKLSDLKKLKGKIVERQSKR